MTCVHQIFPSKLWFLGLPGPSCIWHVYIRSFLLNYGFLVSTWSFMYDMCTSDLSFWTMVSWSLPGPSSMTCVHQIFPSELWFLGLYLVLHVYDMCTSDLSFWTMVSWSLPGPSCMTCVHQIFPSELWFLGLLPGPSCMTCVHQIFPSELWFLGLYLVLHVWHVYIRSFLLNYGFLVSTWSFMYDMCTSDLSFWTMVLSLYLVLHVWHVCTSDLSFWTMVSWSLTGPSCMTCVHQIFPSELWFLGLYLVLHVWHVYIRSFLLNYGFLVSTCTSDMNYGFLVYPSCMTCVHQIPLNWFLGLCMVLHVYDMCTSDLSFWTMVSWSTWFFMYDMYTSDLSFWTMVSWSLPGPSCMTCVHQIFPSELWFLGLYLVLHEWHVYIRSFLLNDIFLVYLVPHVWHVYIRSFLLNYGFLVSTWSFMYDMCTSDLSFWTMVSWSLPGPSCMTCVHQIFPSELMVFWSLPASSCMTCVHQIFPSELWFLGLYLVLHVWHVYIRSFLLNYGFLVSTWSFMYDMCTSDLSFWTMVSWSLPGPSCMTCVHQIYSSELWFFGLYLVLHEWHVYIRSFLLNYGLLVSTWSFMYDMCTSDLFLLNYGFLVYLVLHV